MTVQLYAIGRIVKAFGIKGELIVEPLTSFPERFLRLKEVLVGSESDAVPRSVEGAARDARGVRLRLSDCSDRSKAESLVGSFLFVLAADLTELPQGSYYIDDLVGLRVVTEDGSATGVLSEVMRLPAQDVYVIESDTGRFMIPAVKEFVRSIDLEGRVMVIRMIEGFPEA